MGQRLVIDIEMNGKTLAKVYYHWSGYTSCAIDECVKLINSWKEKKGTTEPEEMTFFNIIRSCGVVCSVLSVRFAHSLCACLCFLFWFDLLCSLSVLSLLCLGFFSAFPFLLCPVSYIAILSASSAPLWTIPL